MSLEDLSFKFRASLDVIDDGVLAGENQTEISILAGEHAVSIQLLLNMVDPRVARHVFMSISKTFLENAQSCSNRINYE